MVNDLYYDGTHFYIKHYDGTISKCESEDLFEKCDVLLSMYGLGNHRTFSEFVDMVNEEDHVIIEGLLKAAVKRIERTYGVNNDNKSKHVTRGSSSNVTPMSRYSGNNEDDDKKMEMFLRYWGASKQELEEAKKKIANRKITNEDISWINSEEILKDDFNLKKALATLKKSREGCVNIKVSLEKMMSSRKHGK